MLKHIDSKKMGRSVLEWLNSHFHFSFAEYYNPDNIKFGVLRVINDDQVKPGTGFDLHPHRNMEILSYVIHGELTHGDSMGNKATIGRGQVQYMSAGKGVIHSEHNYGTEMLRFLQIWILPNADGHTPAYGDYRFDMEERQNRWLALASSYDNAESSAPIKVHADINAYATLLDTGRSLEFIVNNGRQAYMVLMEGKADVLGIHLEERDGLEIIEESIVITATAPAHILLIEMAKAEAE